VAASRKPKREKTLRATTHPADSRVNIPTAELEAFAVEAEAQPSTLLYPRDSSLDPQLVWRGKDEQDRENLAVPVVPVYIQEMIEPRSLIEDLQAESRRRDRQEVPTLFADPFEGLSLEQRVDFYHHDGAWTNRMILGDSMLVMTSLGEKEGLRGEVQMIYLDPPYGIKFGSNWQVSTRRRDVRDGKAEDATRQPEQIRAFRDTWELGIHSYLSYLRDRLVAARDLLTESGSIFVQIGDENVHLVRGVLDEVFGSENFVGLVTFKKTSGAGSFAGGTNVLAAVNDYLVWYAKDLDRVKYRPLYRSKELGGSGGGQYTWVEAPDGQRHRLAGRAPHPDERVLRPDQLTSQTTRTAQTTVFPVEVDGETYVPGKGGWKTNREGMTRLAWANRLLPIGKTLTYVRYLDDFPAFSYTNLWDDTVTSGYGDPKLYVVQTNAKVIERCTLMTTDPGDLVLDPTCGSGTTAYVAEQWGRRWITIDTSRVALALARTRLMTARYPYHLLADSHEGQLKEGEASGQLPPSPSPSTRGDVKKGFVYERVPHITLKSIANNPDLREGMTRAEIDAAIARHADTEVLYDRPYADSKVVRVSGPFTVESLSPHRVPTSSGELPAESVPDGGASRFVERVLDNLRAAGVQNTVRGERLTFDLVEPWTGNGYVHGRGEFAEGGRTRVAAISIGPEHGTVGKELVEAAAVEAIRFAELLVVCGFAFDAYAEGASALGRLKILQAKINPDLQMPDLLKKTGAGNLFMVFGEPDIEVRTDTGGMVTVSIRGLDVYDPTTGVVRSHSTDDIACWFIDTDYDDRSFFVRHAYFLGVDDPYERLRKTLRAEIDEAAWSSLHGTSSRPFPKPSTGKIAVKVINHYGDEILKVHQV
jgi:adenine-specific DNA-methyltransferase